MSTDWEDLSPKYESARTRPDSLDTLVDWPAQRSAVGAVPGKRILDLGCGSGYKAEFFAHSGAASVVGIDISEQFIRAWDARERPANLEFFQGDSARLEEIAGLRGRAFDLIVCFQALSLSPERYHLFASLRRLQPPGGRLVFSTAHPFRYVTLQMEAEGVPPAVAYRDEQPLSYPSPWDPAVTTTDPTPMVSTIVNLLIGGGYRLDRLSEPGLSAEQCRQFPHKASWMDRYFGILLVEATAS